MTNIMVCPVWTTVGHRGKSIMAMTISIIDGPNHAMKKSDDHGKMTVERSI